MYKWHRIGGKGGFKLCVILLALSVLSVIASLSRPEICGGVIVLGAIFIGLPVSLGLVLALLGNLYWDHGLSMGLGIYLGTILINNQVMEALFPNGPQGSCWVVSFVAASTIATIYYCCRTAAIARDRDESYKFEQECLKEHGDEDELKATAPKSWEELYGQLKQNKEKNPPKIHFNPSEDYDITRACAPEADTPLNDMTKMPTKREEMFAELEKRRAEWEKKEKPRYYLDFFDFEDEDLNDGTPPEDDPFNDILKIFKKEN